jgi:hypothetical protein
MGAIIANTTSICRIAKGTGKSHQSLDQVPMYLCIPVFHFVFTIRISFFYYYFICYINSFCNAYLQFMLMQFVPLFPVCVCVCVTGFSPRPCNS